MGIDKELIDKLLADYKGPEDLIGEQGLLKQLTRALVERAMNAEQWLARTAEVIAESRRLRESSERLRLESQAVRRETERLRAQPRAQLARHKTNPTE
jgi:hypothetical protein